QHARSSGGRGRRLDQARSRGIGRRAVSAGAAAAGHSRRRGLEPPRCRAGRPWGNGRLLPAGPLREPLGALARADLIVATGAVDLGDAREVVDAVDEHAPRVPVVTATLVPAECWEAGRMRSVRLPELAGRKLAAFAG